MRNLKRALSLALASVMLLGMMVVGTSAASYPDVKDSDNVEAIEVLNAVGVMIGKKGKFDPDAPVNRHEMAAIMARLFLGEDAETYVGSHPFTDVYPWADKYVAACYENGLINGTSKTTYSGNQPLTAIQAAAMMLRALGYENLSKGATDWRTPVAREANKIQLFDGVASSPNARLTRNQVAQLALNTLEANMVVTNDTSTTVTTPDGTVVEAGRPYYEEIVYDNTYKYDGRTDNRQQLAEKLYGNKLQKNDTTIFTDYGLPATKWTYPNTATEIGKFASDDPVYTWSEKIEDITLGDLYKILGETGALTVYENGSTTNCVVASVTPTKGSSTKSLAAYKGATIYAADDDNDNMADRLCVVYPYLAKVTKVTEAKGNDDRKITLEVWNKGTAGSTTGVTYETEDFAKDDYLLVYPDGSIDSTKGNASTLTDHIIEVKPVETAVGKISAVSGDQGSNVKALTIDGEKYTVGGDKLATKGMLTSKVVKNDTYSFTSETTLYLSNGYILGAEGTNGAKDISNIVYVTARAYQPVGEFGTEAVYRVQVIRMDGTVEILKSNHASGQDTNNTDLSAGFYSISETSGKYDFTPAAAYSAINNSSVYFAKDTVQDAYTMKADDKVVELDGAPDAYLNSNTRIMYVKDSLGDLKTSMTLGPVRQAVEDAAKVLLSKDGSNYIVEAIVIDGEKADASEDVVYVSSDAKETLADSAKNYEYWDAATGEKHKVPVKNDNAPSDGFATYSVDKDGYYKFTAVASGAGTANKDGSHPITEAITLYETWLTEGSELKNADAASATIINATGEDDYDGLSLKEIADADDLAGVVYVVDEKVIAIVITDYTETVLGTAAELTSVTVEFEKGAVANTGTVATPAGTVTGTTINVTFGAVANLVSGDKLVVSANAMSTGATATTASFTLTWDGSAWQADATDKVIVVKSQDEQTTKTFTFGTAKSTDARLETTGVTGVAGGSNTGTYTNLTTTISNGDNKTIVIATPTGTPTANDTITYTVKNIFDNTVTKTITITYNGTSTAWELTGLTGTGSNELQVDAQDGTTHLTYTVSIS